MNQKKWSAFTLVELIVVITILSILGTIAFISLGWYGVYARNSKRISDMKTIEKALSIYITWNSQYPNPDNATNIFYSGALAWTQWSFSSGTIKQLRTMSTAPIDPLFWVDYTYSTINSKTEYQLAGAIEWSFFSYTTPLLDSTYAVSLWEYKSYNIWNYISKDIKISIEDWCTFITAPSLILSDIPVWWNIADGWLYNYSYSDSPNIPSSYSTIESSTPSQSAFQMEEVLDSCVISDISELELYIAQLATAYQSLASYEQYEELIYRFNTPDVKKNMAQGLIDRWVVFSGSVMSILHNPDPFITFSDTFTDTNGTDIASHTPDSPGSWAVIGWDISDYSISGNTLIKDINDWDAFLYPLPSPAITNSDYSIAFDIENFIWGITLYLRYIDANNYYKLDIAPTWYQISQRFWWVDSVITTIADTINIWDRIDFWVIGNTLNLSVAGIEKENILTWWDISGTWTPLIYLIFSGTEIDNYTLTYK